MVRFAWCYERNIARNCGFGKILEVLKIVGSKRHKVCLRELMTKEPKCKAFPIGLFNDKVVLLIDYENLELIFYKFDDCSFNVILQVCLGPH